MKLQRGFILFVSPIEGAGGKDEIVAVLAGDMTHSLRETAEILADSWHHTHNQEPLTAHWTAGDTSLELVSMSKIKIRYRLTTVDVWV